MTDDLRNRGIQALGKLITTGSQEALGELKAWERECITAYPSHEYLGPISPDEGETAAGLVQQMAPDFSLAHPSTYWLDAETIEAAAFTNAVRLSRMQHPKEIGRAEKPTEPFTFSADVERGYSKHVKSTRDVKGRAPTEAEDIDWGKEHDLGRKRVMYLRKNSPDRTSKDRRKQNPDKK